MAGMICAKIRQPGAEPLEKMNQKNEPCSNRLDPLFEQVSDGLAILDLNLTVTRANRALQHLFPEIQVVGEKCFKAFRGRRKPCLNCPALRSVREGKALHGKSPPREQPRGPRALQWTLAPIFSSSGEAEEILLILRNTDTLPHDSFLARLAHELSNPLASITGFSEGLLKRLKTVPPEGLNGRVLEFFKEYLEIINSEAYRCKGILQKIRRENGLRRD